MNFMGIRTLGSPGSGRKWTKEAQNLEKRLDVLVNGLTLWRKAAAVDGLVLGQAHDGLAGKRQCEDE
jgi:hypothetical protein